MTSSVFQTSRDWPCLASMINATQSLHTQGVVEIPHSNILFKKILLFSSDVQGWEPRAEHKPNTEDCSVDLSLIINRKCHFLKNRLPF